MGDHDFQRLSRFLEEEYKIVRYSSFKVWNERLSQPITKEYTVSICTTVMDRLNNLKQTLPANIRDNQGYENVEFVILDYNSKDGVGAWVRSNFAKLIKKGRLSFYRTEEPKYFDMSHSRNLAFKVARGEIVNNVDADAFTRKGFAAYINKLANHCPEKAMFAKSKQLLRGRLGFYKKEFVELLGGYDETCLQFYGHDDQDLMTRAWELGFTMMPFRGKFYGCVPDHVKHQSDNYPQPHWVSEHRNRFISYCNLTMGIFKANEGKEWGKAKLVKNFEEEMVI